MKGKFGKTPKSLSATRASLPLEQNDYCIKSVITSPKKYLQWVTLFCVLCTQNDCTNYLILQTFWRRLYYVKFVAIARSVLIFPLFLGDCVCKDKINNCTNKRKER